MRLSSHHFDAMRQIPSDAVSFSLSERGARSFSVMYAVNFRFRSVVQFERFQFPTSVITVIDLENAVRERYRLTDKEGTRLIFSQSRAGGFLGRFVPPNSDVIGIRLPGRRRRRRRRQVRSVKVEDCTRDDFLRDFHRLGEEDKLKEIGKWLPA